MNTITHHTILLVEDDPNDVLLVQRAFRKANLINPIQVVGDGEAAVAYLAGQGPYADRQRHPLPVLMLLDLKLPRLSGHEVREWLRQQPGLKRLPVVVLSSSQERADVNRAYDLGANSYLVRPVALETLIDMVKTLNLYWMILSEKPEVASDP
ncbi:MAG: response regulator [Chloroflexi bacterium]|nr:response regulator [Chloroflexota bacterium]